MDRLKLVNITFYGHHGVNAAEREMGGDFSVDVELSLDLRTAGQTDKLARTVDYKAVYALVQRVQAAQSYRLLEALAEHIAESVLAEFPVREVLVRARKLRTPVGGLMDHLEVEIVRRAVDRADNER
jgi:dihydroneopterin aldolase